MLYKEGNEMNNICNMSPFSSDKTVVCSCYVRAGKAGCCETGGLAERK